jgi:putative membrane protein
MAFPASRLARYELRRFRGTMPRVALVFVLLVPLLYGAIYLTANWDPYGKLHDLPVAVVNEDAGTTVGGKRLDAGADLVANLHEGRAFDWHDADATEAAHGLAEGDYYLTVTIPSDFSADLVSGQGDDPQRAKIDLRRNDANGFVVGSITNSAQNTIARAVDASAEESYFTSVFANLATIRSGLVDAADGSGTLATGLKDAHTGSTRLAKGSASAESGAKDLSTGASSLASGLDTANTGATSLASGLKQLDTGSGTLATGARQVADGTQQLSDTVVPPLTALEKTLPGIEKNAGAVTTGVNDIAQDATGRTDSVAADLDQASGDLDALVRDHPELKDDPAFRRLTTRVASASDRADDIATTAGTAATTTGRISAAVTKAGEVTPGITKAKNDVVRLNAGAQQVATGASTLHTSIATASTGASSLATGISRADTGAGEVAVGADSLYDGLVTLHDGTTSLDAGLGRLATGADTLHTQLLKGAQRIPVVTPAQQADAVQVLSSPADVTTTIDNPATYYGRGLAPLFFGIALWVFGISVFLVVRPITGRSLAGRASPLRLALAGWLPIAAVATVAGWIMAGVVWLFLGLDPVRPGLLLGVVTLGALCFSAIAHLLRTALGTAGSSLLLVTLILQLSAAGGTYPSPLLPPFFAAIGPYLPLTYLIDAFRVTISGGLLGHLGRDVLVLGVVAALVLGLTLLVVRRRQQFALKDLHPPLTAP